MTWLYSIIFASLLFSSNGDLPKSNNFGDAKMIENNLVRSEETEKFEQTYPLNAGGRVNVSNVNGSIAVETWDRNEVKLEYVKTADDREALADIIVRIEAQPNSFSVETDFGKLYNNSKSYGGQRKNYRRSDVDYRLTVPRAAVLSQIATVNGSVSVTGAANVTKASAVNGEVRATNLRGTATLETVNGAVIADFDQLQTSGRISLNTVNGMVDLMIPSDASATIKADTVNGKISNDFGLPVRKGEYVGSDLYGKMGGGNVQIRLNSVNGALSVRRKNDGKTLNPATDLLNTKSEDDNEDWNDDNENSSGIKPPKPPKPPKAPKLPLPPLPPLPPNGQFDDEAVRQSVEDALKQAQAEIEKIQPELNKINAEAFKQATAAINSEEMKAQLALAQEKYKEAMARMANINWTVGSPNIENKTESFSVKEKPQITVEAQDCAVSVRGWDKSEVQYAVTRFSKNRVQTPLDLKATQNGSSIVIKFMNNDGAARNGDFYNETSRVRIEIFVPKKSDLKIVTSGEIRLEGVSGEIDLQGADAAINVRDSDGKLSAISADGRLRIIGFRGELNAETADGEMNLDGDFRKLSARTVDGTIILTLPENANVNIESNRKDLVGEGVSLKFQSGGGQNTSIWKVGGGGANHLLYTTADGQVIVRAANSIKTF